MGRSVECGSRNGRNNGENAFYEFSKATGKVDLVRLSTIKYDYLRFGTIWGRYGFDRRGGVPPLSHVRLRFINTSLADETRLHLEIFLGSRENRSHAKAQGAQREEFTQRDTD